MKKLFSISVLVLSLLLPTIVSANQAKGLNVIVNTADEQAQAMAMVLSLMTIKKHSKKVNMVLCSKAGDLANKNKTSSAIKRPNGKAPSAKQHLKKLIKLGANIQVCPLYLPNIGADKSVLLDGITVAKPPVIAKRLLNKSFQNITF